MKINAIERFPNITAKTLAGRKITFPMDVKGQQTLVVMVFEDQGRYEQAQNEATAWAIFWQKYLSTYCQFYEIPMMNGQYGQLSFWINAAMRSNLEKEKHDQVACFYGDKKMYQRRLDIGNFSQAQVFLLDEEGQIVSKTSGAPTQGAKEKVLQLLRAN